MLNLSVQARGAMHYRYRVHHYCCSGRRQCASLLASACRHWNLMVCMDFNLLGCGCAADHCTPAWQGNFRHAYTLQLPKGRLGHQGVCSACDLGTTNALCFVLRCLLTPCLSPQTGLLGPSNQAVVTCMLPGCGRIAQILTLGGLH
jgi:hypothetical protein